MIVDKETNHLYLSALLELYYPSFYKSFKKELDRYGIVIDFLQDTKDVWSVDFMPIQIEKDRFVQFVFNPAYLKHKSYRNYISNPSQICKQLGLNIRTTDIIADGGNVVKVKNKAIMTNRVVEDNPHYSSEEDLVNTIKDLLEIDELILIPVEPDDYTGHSDGMLRFLDEDTVLLNDYSKAKDQGFVLELKNRLHNAGLDIIEVPSTILQNSSLWDATGAYINFLQMDGIIFLPIFNRPEDNQVIKLFESLFSDTTIVPIDSTELSIDGGVLNCISWNILK